MFSFHEIIEIFIFFSISNYFTHFYIKQDNIKNPTKKTYKNKQQHKKIPTSHLKMKKATQRYKNPDNIEKKYIQLRFLDYSQLSFCSKKWFIKSLRAFKMIEALIIDQFLSKLNLQFQNNKISIKSLSLTFKILSSIISTVFTRVLQMLV